MRKPSDKDIAAIRAGRKKIVDVTSEAVPIPAARAMVRRQIQRVTQNPFKRKYINKASVIGGVLAAGVGAGLAGYHTFKPRKKRRTR